MSVKVRVKSKFEVENVEMTHLTLNQIIGEKKHPYAQSLILVNLILVNVFVFSVVTRHHEEVTVL